MADNAGAASAQEKGAQGAQAQAKKGLIANLTPTQKKLAAGGLIALAIVAALKISGNNGDPYRDKRPVENVLTDRDPKTLGMDSLLAQIKIANDALVSMKAENGQMRRRMEQMEGQLKGNSQAMRSTASLQNELEDLRSELSRRNDETNEQIQKLTAENQRLNRVINAAPQISEAGKEIARKGPAAAAKDASAAPQYSQQGQGGSGSGSDGGSPEISGGQQPVRDNRSFLDRPVNVRDPYALYREERKPADDLAAAVAAGGDADAGATGTRISVISESRPSSPEMGSDKPRKPDLYLPAGTMLHGVLLSGLYAPTGVNARKDPFPVVLRVQDEAIMPNLKRADLRECFLTLSGYGDISSERALLRGESISCIANDNSVIEAKFPAYAVGEDGKAGIRGKLITRNGKTLRNAMLAGFASGIGDAFQTNAVPKLDISGNSSTTYSSAFSSETLNNGLFKGASEALNRLADYYMSLAEQTFPVIEINAGRDVTVTLTQGTELSTVRGPDGLVPSASGATQAKAGGSAASKGTPGYTPQPTPNLD